VVYYPEQWPESQWDSDLASIADTGMNVIRMEGAWSVWEPGRRCEFSCLIALELCQSTGSRRSWGPHYTPPAWLWKLPRCCASALTEASMHGSRRHYNYTSPIYQRKCQSITEALAEHYRIIPR
jgi:beta-galactosidase